MSVLSNLSRVACLAAFAAGTMTATGCAGEAILGDVTGTEGHLQKVIGNGSKTIGCAPKETALAEANVRFAKDALDMGEYFRGKDHARSAKLYTEIADAKTDPVKCKRADMVDKMVGVVGDRDGDGYDDEVDECPDDPEDFDAYQDPDGCPDPDNDQDGVKDADRFENGQWINMDQLEGRDCRNEPEDKDGFQDEDGCPDPDNDKDGILDVDDKCPNDPEDIDGFEDEDGCPDPDNDKDGILDPQDQCPDVAEDFDGVEDEDGCPDLKAKWDGCKLKLDDKVYFEFNKSDIDPRSFQLLDDVAAALNEGENKDRVTIEIGGHTDSKGSNKYNKKLSQRRVNSVREHLISKGGIADARMTAVGYGEEMPIDTNSTAEGRARNRRVEFVRTDGECAR